MLSLSNTIPLTQALYFSEVEAVSRRHAAKITFWVETAVIVSAAARRILRKVNQWRLAEAGLDVLLLAFYVLSTTAAHVITAGVAAHRIKGRFLA